MGYSYQIWNGENFATKCNDLVYDGSTYVYAAFTGTSPDYTMIKQIQVSDLSTVGTWNAPGGDNTGMLYVTYGGGFLYGVTIGSAGSNLYKIDPSNMTTVGSPWNAPNSKAGSTKPIYNSGFIYFGVTPTSPSVIYKIDVSTMTTAATWTGAAGQNFNSGLCFDGTYLYGCDGNNPTTVEKIDISTMTTSLTWTGSAQYFQAMGLCCDSLGNVYCAEDVAHAELAKIATSTMTDAPAPNNWTGLSFENDVSTPIFSGGFIYIALTVLNPCTILRINPVTMTTEFTYYMPTGGSGIQFLDADNKYLYIPVYNTTTGFQNIVKMDKFDYSQRTGLRF